MTDIASKDDILRLSECLAGKHLPAIGGNEDPADILLRGLSFSSFDRDLANKVSGLLGLLLSAYMDKIKANGCYLTSGKKVSDYQPEHSIPMVLFQEEDFLYNCLVFASCLPTNKILSQALINFEHLSKKEKNQFVNWNKTGRQLRYALIYQQTDSFLEEFWFGIINSFTNKDNNVFSLEELADIMNAWRGLLWIPPSKDNRATGNVVSFDRIEKGMLALHKVFVKTENAKVFLRKAVRILSQAYPNSPNFWETHINERLVDLPELLQKVFFDQWPGLRSPLNIAKVGEDASDDWDILQLRSRCDIAKAEDNKVVMDILEAIKINLSPTINAIGCSKLEIPVDDTTHYQKAA